MEKPTKNLRLVFQNSNEEIVKMNVISRKILSGFLFLRNCNAFDYAFAKIIKNDKLFYVEKFILKIFYNKKFSLT